MGDDHKQQTAQPAIPYGGAPGARKGGERSSRVGELS